MKSLTTNTINRRGLPIILQQLIASCALLILSPLLLLVALLIKLESNGPVIFSQIRVGENGRQFRCFKFRSMYLPGSPQLANVSMGKSDRSGICQKFFNDPRVTKIGRIIRKLSIDEIPQLVNVLKGDMAIIGPRPHLVTEYMQYDPSVLERLNCKPGLTGLWQVSGRADTTFEQQLMLDKQYIANQSFWLDVRIFFATIPAVLLARGAY
ncbi:sugar transferase [Aestuariibacter sp. GS-14]|uniref:sugar transferase n=1 Tax=Aestuariibacter sp. GS-14 TaxID=2590670 RepID=UPI001129C28A|nr:sugar transferase [Aestuariibacter sp. GS-14]TPV59010.1 sugar transferase [Aestuariibacter sp. GS-14]